MLRYQIFFLIQDQQVNKNDPDQICYQKDISRSYKKATQKN